MTQQPRSTPDAQRVNELMALARDYAVSTADGASHIQHQSISKLLRRVREAFRMDVIFVSEFVAGRRVFRHVDAADPTQDAVTEGQSDPVEETYCHRVVTGRLPRAIGDATQHPETRELEVTERLGIVGHLSAPVMLPDGTVFGTLCCFSREPRAELGDSDAHALKAVADLIGASVDKRGVLRSPLLPQDIRTESSGDR